MKTAPIADLKARLSQYLSRVKAGEILGHLCGGAALCHRACDDGRTTPRTHRSRVGGVVGTRTECVAALARRRRDGTLMVVIERQARHVLAELASTWSEVQPSETVRERCERLLAVHSLRAGDALQLAAALLWSRGRTTGHAFVSLDERLREAARREGFRIVPE